MLRAAVPRRPQHTSITTHWSISTCNSPVAGTSVFRRLPLVGKPSPVRLHRSRTLANAHAVVYEAPSRDWVSHPSGRIVEKGERPRGRSPPAGRSGAGWRTLLVERIKPLYQQEGRKGEAQ